MTKVHHHHHAVVSNRTGGAAPASQPAASHRPHARDGFEHVKAPHHRSKRQEAHELAALAKWVKTLPPEVQVQVRNAVNKAEMDAWRKAHPHAVGAHISGAGGNIGANYPGGLPACRNMLISLNLTPPAPGTTAP